MTVCMGAKQVLGGGANVSVRTCGSRMWVRGPHAHYPHAAQPLSCGSCNSSSRQEALRAFVPGSGASTGSAQLWPSLYVVVRSTTKPTCLYRAGLPAAHVQLLWPCAIRGNPTMEQAPFPTPCYAGPRTLPTSPQSART